MITYKSGGINFIFNLGKVHGSIFPKASVVALPNAVIAAVISHMIYEEEAALDHNIMTNNAIWSGFSFLVGFLIIFRTSQAYSRFWEGVTQSHKMGAEWFDACSAIVAFCKYSNTNPLKICYFENLIVRLFSMLHAAALGEIEGSEGEDESGYTQVHAFTMELIDAEALEPDHLIQVRDSDSRVELIYQWIQQTIVENMQNGVLQIPAPVLTRSFQEIAIGMVHFHEAMKISTVPFPFPYAQTCDVLLILHWLLVPFVVVQWVKRAWWAFMFSFIQIFVMWTLNLIAVEIEQPFGQDPNDMDAEGLQLEFNSHLRVLLRKSTKISPKLKRSRLCDLDQLTAEALTCGNVTKSFFEVWDGIDNRTKVRKRMRGRGAIRAGELKGTHSRRSMASLANAPDRRSRGWLTGTRASKRFPFPPKHRDKNNHDEGSDAMVKTVSDGWGVGSTTSFQHTRSSAKRASSDSLDGKAEEATSSLESSKKLNKASSGLSVNFDDLFRVETRTSGSHGKLDRMPSDLDTIRESASEDNSTSSAGSVSKAAGRSVKPHGNGEVDPPAAVESGIEDTRPAPIVGRQRSYSTVSMCEEEGESTEPTIHCEQSAACLSDDVPTETNSMWEDFPVREQRPAPHDSNMPLECAADGLSQQQVHLDVAREQRFAKSTQSSL